MTPSQGFFLPNGKNQCPVHSQSFHRGPSSRRLPDKTNPFPAEMFVPVSEPRIVQCRLFAGLRVSCCLASGFSERTRDTGQGQVLQICLPAGSHGDDMVNMKRRFLSFLG